MSGRFYQKGKFRGQFGTLCFYFFEWFIWVGLCLSWLGRWLGLGVFSWFLFWKKEFLWFCFGRLGFCWLGFFGRGRFGGSLEAGFCFFFCRVFWGFGFAWKCWGFLDGLALLWWICFVFPVFLICCKVFWVGWRLRWCRFYFVYADFQFIIRILRRSLRSNPY